MTLARTNRRQQNVRMVRITRNFIKWPAGSALVEFGNTRVICTAMIEDKVPPHCMASQQGWVTAEYSMIPGCSQQRVQRDAARGKPNGRTQEIQRLIGRALRAVIDLKAFGPRTIWIDCDVIQADGGTRTASVTGAAVAAHDAFTSLLNSGVITTMPMKQLVSAISTGIVDNVPVVDLEYIEDKDAEVDMNVVATEDGNLVEVQGTGEQRGFSRAELQLMLDLAQSACARLHKLQRAALANPDGIACLEG